MALALKRIPHFRIGDVDVPEITRETAGEVLDDDVAGLAAEMAYHSILAIFPFLLFLAGVTSIIDDIFPVGDLTQRIVDKASQVMPEDATSVIESFTREVVTSRGTFAIAAGLIGTLWSASNAIGSAMKALNRAYDVKEDRSYFTRKAIAVALTLLFTGIIFGTAVLLGTGSLMAGGIGHALGWSGPVQLLWNAGTPVLSLVLLTFAVAMLYWLAPNTGHKLTWITPGAALFVVGWIAASVIFALYVGNFASYNRTYGSLGAVIILLVWLYWTNYLLLVGGELNAVLARHHDPEYRSEQGTNKPRGQTPARP